MEMESKWSPDYRTGRFKRNESVVYLSLRVYVYSPDPNPTDLPIKQSFLYFWLLQE